MPAAAPVTTIHTGDTSVKRLTSSAERKAISPTALFTVFFQRESTASKISATTHTEIPAKACRTSGTS